MVHNLTEPEKNSEPKWLTKNFLAEHLQNDFPIEKLESFRIEQLTAEDNYNCIVYRVHIEFIDDDGSPTDKRVNKFLSFKSNI